MVMKPSLSEIQDVINRTAIQILRCTKRIIQWGQDRSDTVNELASFYEGLAQEKEVCKLVLLLTGSLLGAEMASNQYLQKFEKYSFLWEKNMQKEYADFLDQDPSLEDFDDMLMSYVHYEEEINQFPESHNIGVLSLRSENIKRDLMSFTTLWKTQYTKNLLEIARDDLSILVEYMQNTTRKMCFTSIESPLCQECMLRLVSSLAQLRLFERPQNACLKTNI